MLNANYLKSLSSGYLNENGIINIDFVDGFPQTVAKDLSSCTPALSTSQSRAFFDRVNALNMKLKSKQISMDEVCIELSMLKSRLQDKVSKNTLSKEFFEFFDKNVAAVKDPKTMNAFTLHFEAVCNYIKDVKQGGNNNFSQTPRNNSYQGNNNFKNNNFNRK